MTGYVDDSGPFAIHAYLSLTAKTAWSMMSEHNGVSITGLMEAMGGEWAKEIKANDGEADGLHLPLVRAARKIDAQRRRRGKK